MTKQETESPRRVFKFEWLAIVLIFAIAFATGYFYTRARLVDNQEQVELSGDIK